MSLQGDRILKERGKFEIPLSLSGVLWLLSFDTERQLTPQIFDLAGGSYAQLSSLRPGAQHASRRRQEKKPPQKNDLYYPSRDNGRNIYLSPAAAGDIYFVRADRRGIIKSKKRSTPQKSSIYYPSRGSGRHIYLSPAAAGDIYFVCAVRPGIIKRKKESPRRKTIFTIPPASAGGIIKRKKRKAQRAFLFFEFN